LTVVTTLNPLQVSKFMPDNVLKRLFMAHSPL
jgi:hypothetical protein